ncbi:MAG: dihydropteroate synthase [Halobacteriales archaeon SW_9_67_25]|jgi:dihydropteroate synthase|nr:MAG: dihydropteroate synthase [Halobacteriales archaeon SW_9_67_25]
MEYHEAVNTLEGLRRVRPKLGTETTASLLSFLDVPYGDLSAVQIAGSNGKGSTARVLERVLTEAGLDVGLYTSPDLNDVRDRVRVCGRPIPKHQIVAFVEAAWPFVVERSVEGSAPTFFEVATAMALWHFDREDVDVAVLEVGIGGRYDATSVVDPEAAAVTTVSLEHTDLLGETVAEIASDKVQVAPADRPLVTGATGDALATIREETDILRVGPGPGGIDGTADSPEVDVRATETEMISATESAVSIAGPDWSVETETSLLGRHQAVNAGIAAALARQVADVSEATIAAGVRNATWPGRFEIVERAPLVVLDGAHNPAACETLATLLDRYEYDRLRLVFGAMHDKDHVAVARALPDPDSAYIAAPGVDRAQDTDTLATVFEGETGADVSQLDAVLGALDRALSDAAEDDCVLVAGSLYTVGEARDHWTRLPRAVRTPTEGQVRSLMRESNVPAGKRREHAASGVHRTVRLHARRAMAAELREVAFAVGARCVVSGITAADQHVEVVLTGTLAQYRRLARKLRDSEGEGRHLAAQIRRALRADTEGPSAWRDEGGTDGAAGAGNGTSDGDYPWNRKTAVMGILNVTPDSFHDGGRYEALEDALARAEEMVAAGADVVDVGGESTRPGADPVPVETERERVLPVVERLADLDAMVSVDTRKPAVAAAALDAGADIVNDVTGLADAKMRRLVADRGVPAVVMHSLAAPVDPERGYRYDDVVDHILAALNERLLLAERAGIDRSQVIVDPGLGFGKEAAESFELLDRLREFRALGAPVMVGHSNKSMFADVAGEDRTAPTVAATALAADRGVDLVRVHDVAPNAAAVRTVRATLDSR